MHPVFFQLHKMASVDVLTGRMGAGKTTVADKLRDQYDLVLPTDFSRPKSKKTGTYIDPSKQKKEKIRAERREQIFKADAAGKRVLVEGHPPGVIKLFRKTLPQVDKVYEIPLSVEQSFSRVLQRALAEPKERDVMTDMDSAVSNNKKYDRYLEQIRRSGVPIVPFPTKEKTAATVLPAPNVQEKVDQHLTPSQAHRWQGFGKSLRSKAFVEAFRKDERSTAGQKRSAWLRHLHVTAKDPGIKIPGSTQAHTVKFHPEQKVFTCSCNDFTLSKSSKGGECKHITAAKQQGEYLQKEAFANPLLRIALFARQREAAERQGAVARGVADAYEGAFPGSGFHAPLRPVRQAAGEIAHAAVPWASYL